MSTAQTTADARPPMLAQFLENIRPTLADRKRPTKTRVRLLWSAVHAARNLAAADVMREAFMTLACEVGLINRRGWWLPSDVRDTVRRHGADDVASVITWALRGQNPFEGGAAHADTR